jgi:protein SCO1/2
MKRTIAHALAILALLGVAGTVRHSLHAAAAAGPRAAYFPDVILRNQDGKPVRFYTDLVHGKIVLINFFYAHCDGICPGVTENLVRVQNALGDRAGHVVQMYSISLDPTRDTPEVLKAYAEAYGVKPGWQFLTGKPADIELLRRRLGLVDLDPKVDRIRGQHLGMLIIGNESLDRWCAQASLSNPRQIVTALSWMKPRGKDPRAAAWRNVPLSSRGSDR